MIQIGKYEGHDVFKYCVAVKDTSNVHLSSNKVFKTHAEALRYAKFLLKNYKEIKDTTKSKKHNALIENAIKKLNKLRLKKPVFKTNKDLVKGIKEYLKPNTKYVPFGKMNKESMINLSKRK